MGGLLGIAVFLATPEERASALTRAFPERLRYIGGMLIAQLEPPHATHGGDWFYRTHSPGGAMAAHEAVHVVDLVNTHRARDAVLERADVLILNMVCDPDLLPVIVDRKRRGQATVYEVNDDVAWIQPWNPTAAFFRNPDNQMLFRLLVRECDAVQFTCAELARIYGGLNERRRVFPNQMAHPPRREASYEPGRQPVIVGWGGSAGHFEDIAAIAPTLVDWARRHENVVIHLMCGQRIASLFSTLDKRQRRIFPTGSIDAYHEFVSGLHIGLAPLEDTGFNRCRSDVKFLEYALHGVVPVVRDLAPYRDTVRHGETGLLFRDVSQLPSLLDDLVADPALCHRLASAAQGYVAAERTEQAHAEARLSFYRELCAPQDVTREPALFEELAALQGATRRGRHLSLEPTRYERLLHDALVIGQKPEKRKQGVKLLRDAMRLQPHAYQPHLFGCAVATNPLPWLEQALTLNPRSLMARMVLSGVLADSGNVPGALQHLLKAAETHPGYDLPYLRLGELLVRLGQAEQAREFLAAAENIRAPCRDVIP